VPSPGKRIARRLLPHSLYRRYRRRKVAALIAQYPARVVSHDYAGRRLQIELADPLAEGWYDRDWSEPTAISFLRGRGVLTEGATVLDVGAHQAVIALMLAGVVGPDGHVVAVEAEPHNARIAERNRELNGAENLTVIHAAGGAAAGVLSFAEGLNGQIDESTSSGNVEVQAVTVDELVARFGPPSLVMIDVEGYEGEVLRGAGSVLGDGSTAFLVEVHEEIADFGSSADEILALFADYERFVAVEDDDPLRALEDERPAGRFFLVALPRPVGAPGP
jgi:FkbM family methyltransferase